MLKDPYKVRIELSARQNSAISLQVAPASVLGVGYCQRTLVDESIMIRTQIRKTIDQT
jgi:hypothetical protein